MKLEILLVAVHGACDYLQRELLDLESYNERLGLPEPLTPWEMRQARVLGSAISRLAVAAAEERTAKNRRRRGRKARAS
jgi:hypothetical protein